MKSDLIKEYLEYIRTVKRYSTRTCSIYSDVLERFSAQSLDPSVPLEEQMTPVRIRNYEVYLMDDCKLGARTVGQHLSVLSSFSNYLIKRGAVKSNPVHLVTRPKAEKRLPVFYREESMKEYLDATAHSASEDELEILRSCISPEGKISALAQDMYERRLRRLIVAMLYSTGMRRAELISLDDGNFDLSLREMHVLGKGGKMRDIPLTTFICNEISLYIRARDLFFSDRGPLLRTWSGKRLYPVFVDRAIKQELGSVASITGRKSPHVLRHTLATELLDNGTDLNSIKELLGHSSLAATQVYTHNSIDKMRKVYASAHPHAKKQ